MTAVGPRVVLNRRGGAAWEGANRSLINLARALAKGGEVRLAWWADGAGGVPTVPGVEVLPWTGGRPPVPMAGVTAVLTDDDWANLREVRRLRLGPRTKSIAYAQILWGLHSILSCFDLTHEPRGKRMVYGASRLIPFGIFARQYRRAVRVVRFVVPNSSYTGSLLRSLYGIEPRAVVHPPVDTDIFRPGGGGAREGVLLYLGSHGGDTNGALLATLVKGLAAQGMPIRTFGNGRLARELADRVPPALRLGHVHGVEDEELADVYSRALAVVCPQGWELFGYVAAEAAACGTPVVAPRSAAFPEFIDPSMGILVDWGEDMARAVEGIAKGEPRFDPARVREGALRGLSIAGAAVKLEPVLGGG